MDRARQQVNGMLDALQGTDLHLRPGINGKTFNSAFWIAAHLAVSQNWLILRGTAGPFRKFSWAKHFSIGSTPVPEALCPPWPEVRGVMDEVHQAALAHLSTLGDADLDRPHEALMELSGGNAMRDIVAHHILHEAGHAGQLGWLCKLQGLPMR